MKKQVKIATKQYVDDLLHGGTISSSLDNYKDNGVYWVQFNSSSNAPYTSGYGWLHVISHASTGACIQMVYRFSSGITQICIRSFTNSQWYNWRKIDTLPA